ncbi:flagellar assembly protein FliH [Zobellella aerophila]|uniref:Flagellar assembly protein FliH n=1 Tax=Zobellella aerophila TaxID=870480 RepID=A0ABP6VRK3_9GAMM
MFKPFEPDADGNGRREGDDWQPWQMDQLGRQQALQQSQQELARQEKVRLQAFRRNAELETLREQARQAAHEQGYHEGFEAGRQDGYRQGLEQGRSAGAEEARLQAEQTLSPLLPLAQNFSTALSCVDDDIAQALVALALATGRQLAADALDAHPEQVLSLIRELLHVEPALTGTPRLWLHPADLDLVHTHLGAELAAAGWQLQPDDQLSRGGCRVTSTGGELDASWESRWQAVIHQQRKRTAHPEQTTPEQVP